MFRRWVQIHTRPAFRRIALAVALVAVGAAAVDVRASHTVILVFGIVLGAAFASWWD
jgi:hypothetical protein